MSYPRETTAKAHSWKSRHVLYLGRGERIRKRWVIFRSNVQKFNRETRKGKVFCSFYRKIEIVNLLTKRIDRTHTSSTLLRPTCRATNSSLYWFSCSDVQAIGANEKGADKERFHGHDDHVLLVPEPSADQSTRKSRHRVHNGAEQPGFRENSRQRGKLQLRVRRPPREPGSRWTSDALGRSSSPRRGVSGNDAGGDRRPIRGRLAPTGRPPRHQIPLERLLQAQFRAGHHQASERRISRGGEQRRRGGGATILGIPVRSTSRQYLTEHRAPAKDQLEDGALPSTRPRPRVSLSRRHLFRRLRSRTMNDRCFLLSLRTEHRGGDLKLSSFQMRYRDFVTSSILRSGMTRIFNYSSGILSGSPPPIVLSLIYN